VVKTGFNPMAA